MMKIKDEILFPLATLIICFAIFLGIMAWVGQNPTPQVQNHVQIELLAGRSVSEASFSEITITMSDGTYVPCIVYRDSIDCNW